MVRTCRECGSDRVVVNKHPIAWFGGLWETGVPNVEVYCCACTVSYCEAFLERQKDRESGGKREGLKWSIRRSSRYSSGTR